MYTNKNVGRYLDKNKSAKSIIHIELNIKKYNEIDFD